jgi:regulator of sirC expression with transglutaminase-like and TPR domain
MIIGLPEHSLEPGDAEKNALLVLLADEDPQIYKAIRAKIVSYGMPATKWLHRAALSRDPVQRRRVMEIIQLLSRESADNDFLGFCLNQSEELDVEEGSLLLAKTQYPEINIEAYQAVFDSYASDLREQIKDSPSVENTIASINHFLFNELRYHGNEEHYYDPENSYLNRVVDRRTGNPVTLCALFLLLAKRLQLPITGIGMPGHFLCRYQSLSEELFIDVFNRGKLLTKADCVKYLLHTRDGFKETYLAPISGRRMLLRICSNLHQVYTQHGCKDELIRFQRYIVALAK